MTPLEDRAYENGRMDGISSGSWVTDGNTSRATYEAIVRMYDDGDPALWDLVHEPSPLSGEWADGLLPRDVLAELSTDEDKIDEEDVRADDLLSMFEQGFSDGFWDEVLRACRIQLEDGEG